MATKIKGIDVSKYQKNVDYEKVKKSGVDFVLIRAGYGKYITQKDSEFEKHYKNAKVAGLKVGAYWYSYASSVEEAKEEAKICLQAIKGKTFEYPIYFDLEEQSQFAKANLLKARAFVTVLLRHSAMNLKKQATGQDCIYHAPHCKAIYHQMLQRDMHFGLQNTVTNAIMTVIMVYGNTHQRVKSVELMAMWIVITAILTTHQQLKKLGKMDLKSLQR